MKTRARLSGLTLLSMAAAFVASAADAPRYSFECDAPGGNYSSWTRSVSTRHIEIAGKLHVDAFYDHKKYLPVATIVLVRNSDHATRFGIRISPETVKSRTLSIELFKVGGRDTIGSMNKSAKSIAFTLRFEPDGTVSATVGDSKGSVKVVDFKPEQIELGCSTGSFGFTDVTVRETD